MKKKFLDLNTERGEKIKFDLEMYFDCSGRETIEIIGRETKATHILDFNGWLWKLDKGSYVPF